MERQSGPGDSRLLDSARYRIKGKVAGSSPVLQVLFLNNNVYWSYNMSKLFQVFYDLTEKGIEIQSRGGKPYFIPSDDSITARIGFTVVDSTGRAYPTHEEGTFHFDCHVADVFRAIEDPDVSPILKQYIKTAPGRAKLASVVHSNFSRNFDDTQIRQSVKDFFWA